jgi:hypothetical protein
LKVSIKGGNRKDCMMELGITKEYEPEIIRELMMVT